MKHSYSVWIHTGDHPLAGTDCNITIQLIGTQGKTAPIVIVQEDVYAFERDSIDRVTIETDIDIGDLVRCCLSYDNSMDNHWFVKSVRIRDNIRLDEWRFEFEDWIIPEHPDTPPTCADVVSRE